MNETIHATCVRLDGAGVLLRGPSGSGKSDLAFRLVSDPQHPDDRLVADDQVSLALRDGAVIADAPVALSGLLELRGLGLLRVPVCGVTAIALVVDLTDRDRVPRIAEPLAARILGQSLPLVRLHAFDVTTPAKLRLALRAIARHGFPGDDGLLKVE